MKVIAIVFCVVSNRIQSVPVTTYSVPPTPTPVSTNKNCTQCLYSYNITVLSFRGVFVISFVFLPKTPTNLQYSENFVIVHYFIRIQKIILLLCVQLLDFNIPGHHILRKMPVRCLLHVAVSLEIISLVESTVL